MKQRILKVIKISTAVLIAGCAYAVFFKLTGFGIPCLFRVLTGFECPGCGMTRMCTSLVMLDFRAAWSYNPVMMCLLPFGILLIANALKRYITTGINITPKWETAVIVAMIVVLVIFGVVRNIV